MQLDRFDLENVFQTFWKRVGNPDVMVEAPQRTMVIMNNNMLYVFKQFLAMYYMEVGNM